MFLRISKVASLKFLHGSWPRPNNLRPPLPDQIPDREQHLATDQQQEERKHTSNQHRSNEQRAYREPPRHCRHDVFRAGSVLQQRPSHNSGLHCVERDAQTAEHKQDRRVVLREAGAVLAVDVEEG